MTSFQTQILSSYHNVKLRRQWLDRPSPLNFFEWKIDILAAFEGSHYLYLDLPNLTIQKDLDVIFQQIKQEGYFLCDAEEQICDLHKYSPEAFTRAIGIPHHKYQDKRMFGAGILGLNRHRIQSTIDTAFQMRYKGVLNPSSWKDQDNLDIEQKSSIGFRFDQTLLNWLFYHDVANLKVHQFTKYCEKPGLNSGTRHFLYRRRHYNSVDLSLAESRSQNEKIYIAINIILLRAKFYLSILLLKWRANHDT